WIFTVTYGAALLFEKGEMEEDIISRKISRFRQSLSNHPDCRSQLSARGYLHPRPGKMRNWCVRKVQARTGQYHHPSSPLRHQGLSSGSDASERCTSSRCQSC